MKRFAFLLTLAIIISSFFTGCSSQPKQKDVMPSEEPTFEKSYEVEPISYVFTNMEDLIAHLKQVQLPQSDTAVPEIAPPKKMQSFYVPDMAAFEGFKLFQIELVPDFIIYYLMPADSETSYFDYEQGITVTYCISESYTLSGISSQLELDVSDGNYLYNSSNGDIAFSDPALVIIHAPEKYNSVEKLKSLCRVEKLILNF